MRDQFDWFAAAQHLEASCPKYFCSLKLPANADHAFMSRETIITVFEELLLDPKYVMEAMLACRPALVTVLSSVFNKSVVITVKSFIALVDIMYVEPYLRGYICNYLLEQRFCLNDYLLGVVDESLFFKLAFSALKLLKVCPLQTTQKFLHGIDKLCLHEKAEIRWAAIECIVPLFNLSRKSKDFLVSSLLNERSSLECYHSWREECGRIQAHVSQMWLESPVHYARKVAASSHSSQETSVFFTEVCDVLLPVKNIVSKFSGLSSSGDQAVIPTDTFMRCVQSMAFALCQNEAVALFGSSGSGKSALIDYLACKTGNNDYITLFVDDQTDAKSTLGSYIASSTPGEFVWHPGLLSQAVVDGKWLVVKNIDMAPTDFVDCLKPLLEHRKLHLYQRAEVLDAAPGFRLIVTVTNSDKKDSIFSMSSNPIKNLFTFVNVPSKSITEMVEIVQKKFPALPKNVIGICVLTHVACSNCGSVSTEKLPYDWEVALHNASAVSNLKLDEKLNVGRQFSLRDLLKVSNRLAKWSKCINSTSSNISEIITIGVEIRENCCKELLDCYVAMLPATESRRKISLFLSWLWGLSSNGSFLIAKPIITDDYIEFKVGRATLPKNTIMPPVPIQSLSHTSQMVLNMESILVALANSEPLLLVGETGTGKSSIVQYIANKTGQKLIVLNLSQQTESSDLLGGFHPLETGTVWKPLLENFLNLFMKTFPKGDNMKFIERINKYAKKKSWKKLLTAFQSTIDKVEELYKYQNSAFMSEAALRKKKLFITSSLRNKWKSFFNDVLGAEKMMNASDSGVAFAFVEGNLARAIREGHWLLLDEINLAPPEALERLTSLISSTTGSLLINERGDTKALKRHDNFRLIAAMNPATDVGKTNLPDKFRQYFTEIYVPEVIDRDDLLQLVAHSLQLLNCDGGLIAGIVSFYLAAREAATNCLYDAAGGRPCYSLRALTRSLEYIKFCASTYGCLRAAFDGLEMVFVTLLHPTCAPKLEAILKNNIFPTKKPKDINTLLKGKSPRSGENNQVLIEDYLIQAGSFPINDDHAKSFILTPSVSQHLRHLARAAMIKKFPVLLQGPTSSGKTSLIAYLATMTGHRCIRINNHQATDLQEYMGSYVTDSLGRLVFAEGALVKALRNGDWIILDELNLAPTEILEALNRLLDDNRELFVPEINEYVKPHPDFMLFATQNPAGIYSGRKVLSRALRSRFVEIYVGNIPEDELPEILHKRCAIAPSHAQRIVNVMLELQRRRQVSNVFAGKDGFSTPRDLFKWGSRSALVMDDLAMNGFMILGERLRSVSERKDVENILSKILNVKIDAAKFYKARGELLRAEILILKAHANVSWTPSMNRMFTLLEECFKHSEPALLIGETGTGKTTVCQLLAQIRNQKLHILNCNLHTESSDFVGSYRPVRGCGDCLQQFVVAFEELKSNILFKNSELGSTLMDDMSSETILTILNLIENHLGNVKISTLEYSSAVKIFDRMKRLSLEAMAPFEWFDGPLVTAMRNGDCILIDEINLAEDAVLERLNSVLETGRTLTISEKGGSGAEEVIAHPNFRLVATMNPGGDHGKRELTAALTSRFTTIWIPRVDNIEELALITKLHLKDNIYSSQIVNLLLPFWQFFCAEAGNVAHLLSVRDILSWVEFINSTYLRIGYISSFLHGAYLVLIDGLGIGLGMSNLSTSDLRLKCESFIKCQLGSVADESMLDIHPNDYPRLLSENKWGFENFFLTTSGLVECDYSFKSDTIASNTMRVLRAMQLRKAILLEGSPGVGKTSLISAIAKATGNTLVRINLSEQTDMLDLLGADLPDVDSNTGNFKWCDGPLLAALKLGHWVLLDELNLASQNVLEGLNSMLDHRGEIFIPELNMTYRAPLNFRIFACQNPVQEGGGRRQLPKSFLNRFTKVFIDLLTHIDYIAITESMFSNINSDIIKRVVKFVICLHQEANVKHAFAQVGSPWEFNLRDLIRWGHVVTYLSDNLKDKDNATESICYALKLIFEERLRTEEDRTKFYDIAASCGFKMLSLPVKFTMNNSGLQIGRICIKPCALIMYLGVDSVGDLLSLGKLQICQEQLPMLEHMACCIQLNWPLLLTGTSESGKSSLIKILAGFNNVNLVVLSLNSSTDISDLLGGFEQYEPLRHYRNTMNDVRSHVFKIINLLNYNIDGSHNFLHSIMDILSALSKVLLLCDVRGSDVEDYLGNFKMCRLHLVEISSKYKSLLVRASESIAASISLIDTILSQSLGQNKSGRFEWVDGSLTQALENGYWVILDNANLCNPSILDRLNPLLEPGGHLLLNEAGAHSGVIRKIVAHSNFRLFLTVDPRYGEVSRAMRNRCIELSLSAMASTARMDQNSLMVTPNNVPFTISARMQYLHDQVCDKYPWMQKMKYLRQWCNLFTSLTEQGWDSKVAFTSAFEEVYFRSNLTIFDMKLDTTHLQNMSASVFSIHSWPSPLSVRDWLTDAENVVHSLRLAVLEFSFANSLSSNNFKYSGLGVGKWQLLSSKIDELKPIGIICNCNFKDLLEVFHATAKFFKNCPIGSKNLSLLWLGLTLKCIQRCSVTSVPVIFLEQALLFMEKFSGLSVSQNFSFILDDYVLVNLIQCLLELMKPPSTPTSPQFLWIGNQQLKYNNQPSSYKQIVKCLYFFVKEFVQILDKVFDPTSLPKLPVVASSQVLDGISEISLIWKKIWSLLVININTNASAFEQEFVLPFKYFYKKFQLSLTKINFELGNSAKVALHELNLALELDSAHYNKPLLWLLAGHSPLPKSEFLVDLNIRLFELASLLIPCNGENSNSPLLINKILQHAKQLNLEEDFLIAEEDVIFCLPFVDSLHQTFVHGLALFELAVCSSELDNQNDVAQKLFNSLEESLLLTVRKIRFDSKASGDFLAKVNAYFLPVNYLSQEGVAHYQKPLVSLQVVNKARCCIHFLAKVTNWLVSLNNSCPDTHVVTGLSLCLESLLKDGIWYNSVIEKAPYLRLMWLLKDKETICSTSLKELTSILQLLWTNWLTSVDSLSQQLSVTNLVHVGVHAGILHGILYDNSSTLSSGNLREMQIKCSLRSLYRWSLDLNNSSHELSGADELISIRSMFSQILFAYRETFDDETIIEDLCSDILNCTRKNFDVEYATRLLYSDHSLLCNNVDIIRMLYNSVGSKQQQAQCLGVSWVLLGILRLQLVFPAKDLDPALIPQLESQGLCSLSNDWLKPELKILNSMNSLIGAFSVNDQISQTQDSLNQVLEEANVYKSEIVFRGNNDEYRTFYQQLSSYCRTISSKESLLKILSNAQKCSSVDELAQWKLSTINFLKQFERKFYSYKDLISPIKQALEEISFGFGILMDNFKPSVDVEKFQLLPFRNLGLTKTAKKLDDLKLLPHILYNIYEQRVHMTNAELIKMCQPIFDKLLGFWKDSKLKELDELAIEPQFFIVKNRSYDLEFDQLFAFESDEDNFEASSKGIVESEVKDMNKILISGLFLEDLMWVHEKLFSCEFNYDKLDIVRWMRITAETYDILVRTTSQDIGLNRSLDEELCLSHILRLLNLSHEEKNTNLQDLDFLSSQLSETLLLEKPLNALALRLKVLLEEWPENVLLNQLMHLCSKLLGLPLKIPFKSIVTGLELLIDKAQLWEQSASAAVSLKVELDALLALSRKWRKIELSSWKVLLDRVVKQHESGCNEFWYHLYCILFESPLTAESLEAVVTSLLQFIRNSSIGDFKYRLHLLECFRNHAHALRLQPILNILNNMILFHNQFLPNVKECLDKELTAVKKHLEDFVKLQKWEDRGYYAQKLEVEKSQRQLYKFMKDAAKVLSLSSYGVMDKFSSISKESTLHFIKDDANTGSLDKVWLDQHLVIKKSWMLFVDKMEDFASINPATGTSYAQRIPQLAKLMSSILLESAVGYTTDNVPLPFIKGVLHIDELGTTAAERAYDLKRSSDKDSKSMKKKGLVDLLQALNNLGFSNRRSSVPANQRDFVHSFLVICPESIVQEFLEDEIFMPIEFKTLWQKSCMYYYRCIIYRQRLVEASHKHHVDVSDQETKAAVNLAVSMVYTLQQERGKLFTAVNCINKISQVIEKLINFNVKDAEEIVAPNFERVFNNIKDVYTFLQSEVNLLSAMLIVETETFNNQHLIKGAKDKLLGWINILLPYLEKLKYLKESESTFNDFILPPMSTYALADINQVLLNIVGECENSESFSDNVPGWKQLATNLATLDLNQITSYCNISTKVSIREEFNNVAEEIVQDILKWAQNLKKITSIVGNGEIRIIDLIDRFDACVAIQALNKILDKIVNGMKHMKNKGDDIKYFANIAKLLENVKMALHFVILQYICLIKSTSKVCYISTNILSEIIECGFCTPDEVVEEDTSGKANEFEGTGMGDGEGLKDVSDEIENEDQVVGTKNESESDQREDKPPPENGNKGLEMEEDFQGLMDDVSSADDSASEEDDLENQLQEEMGDVGDLGDTVDEKLWEGDDKQETQFQKSEDVLKMDDTSNLDFEAGDEDDDQHEPNESIETNKDNADHDLEVDDNEEAENPEDFVKPTDEDIGEPSEETVEADIQSDDIDVENMQIEDDDGDNDDANQFEEGNDKMEETAADDGAVEDDVIETDGCVLEKEEKALDGDNNNDEEKDSVGLDEEFKNESLLKNGENHLEAANDSSGNHANEEGANNNSFNTTNTSEDSIDIKEESLNNPTNETSEHNEASNLGKGEGETQSTPAFTNELKEEKEKVRDKANPYRSLGSALEEWHADLNIVSDDEEKVLLEENAKEAQYKYVEENQDMQQGDDQVMAAATEDQATEMDVDRVVDEMAVNSDDSNLREMNGKSLGSIQASHNNVMDDSTDVMDEESLDYIDTDNIEDLSNNFVSLKTEVGAQGPKSDIEIIEENSITATNISSKLQGARAVLAQKTWEKCEQKIAGMASDLTEQLRLLLEPTKASRLKGDYKSGKRLSMRKVIAYVASHFRKDKIWMRRNFPDRRQYQVIVAIDNSKSMHENKCDEFALESVCLVLKALSQLEVGNVGVLKFGGSEGASLLKPINETFATADGCKIFSELCFNQDNTIIDRPVVNLIKSLHTLLKEAEDNLPSSLSHASVNQLVIIVSDGRFHEKDELQKAVMEAQVEGKRILAFVALDNPKSTILDMQSVTFENGKPFLKILGYISIPILHITTRYHNASKNIG